MKTGKEINVTALSKMIECLVNVDVPAIERFVEKLKAAFPGTSNEDLVQKIFSKAQLKCAASGFFTGLPSNIVAMVPAAFADVGITLRHEVNATAAVALIYDPVFFEDETAKWALLIPVLGINSISQFAQSAAVKSSKKLTSVAMKKYLSKETLKQFKKIMLKYLGIKVTKKAILTKAVPVVGGIVGGSWNWVEVHVIKKRTLRYFQDYSTVSAA